MTSVFRRIGKRTIFFGRPIPRPEDIRANPRLFISEGTLSVTTSEDSIHLRKRGEVLSRISGGGEEHP
jgi:hypothetical protein